MLEGYRIHNSNLEDVSTWLERIGILQRVAGTDEYRGFVIDNVFHSVSEGDIHYNVYIPESYDGRQP